jgi:NAD(P)-dependent dehydrogenase (short-subunit alcohol dehydrogenase family)
MPNVMNDAEASSDNQRHVAVVAGGSGALGRSVCESLAMDGWSVAVLCHRRVAAAEEVLANLRRLGCTCAAWQLDLEDPAACRRVFQAIAQQQGRIGAAVYAAGPTITIEYLSRIAPSEFIRVMTADVTACFNFIQAALPQMRDGGGALIGITTEQLERIELRGALSSVPKAAVDKLFEVVAKEEARHGIRAATVRAGWVDAGLGADALAEKLPPDALKAMIDSIPLRRFGLPHEIADVISFLVSPRAGYITGVSIPVNGGRHL